jgi:NDP-sugar pyrophosphorylase family protein
MILAAGQGTRLGALGRRVPKVLVEIGGEPLLLRQLRYLWGQGVDRIVMNAHHLSDQVVEFVRSLATGEAVEVVVEPVLLGTAGGVRNALPRLGLDPFVVLYGDVLVEARIERILADHRERGADATLAVYESTETTAKGIVEVDADLRVSAFVEKPAEGAAARSAWVNAGLYVLEPALVAAFVSLGQVADFGHDVFPAALRSGKLLVAHPLATPVLDIGTPEALDLARSVLKPARSEPRKRL